MINLMIKFNLAPMNIKKKTIADDNVATRKKRLQHSSIMLNQALIPRALNKNKAGKRYQMLKRHKQTIILSIGKSLSIRLQLVCFILAKERNAPYINIFNSLNL